MRPAPPRLRIRARPPARGVTAFGAVLGVLTLAAAACTVSGGGGIHTLPPAPERPSTTTTQKPPDLTDVALAEVAGQTTTTIEMAPGEAELSGTVVAEEGPVANATVRVQRIVGEGVAHVDVLTAEDGTWQVPFLKGGLIRVRAWLAPELALTDPQVFFLAARETRSLDLRLERFSGLRVTSDIAPEPPVVGEPAHLIVQVTDEQVDPEGVVQAQIVAGISVELFGSGNWRVSTENPTPTDGAGNASFTVRCDQSGTQPLSVVVGDIQTFPIGVPDCAPPPRATTTSTTERSTSSSSTSSTTTTSRSRNDDD